MNEFYIQKMIYEMKELEILKNDLEAEIKKRVDEIKQYMRTNSLEELQGNHGEKVIYRSVITKRFDSTEFKKRFKDLYDAYLKTTTTQRFKFSF